MVENKHKYLSGHCNQKNCIADTTGRFMEDLELSCCPHFEYSSSQNDNNNHIYDDDTENEICLNKETDIEDYFDTNELTVIKEYEHKVNIEKNQSHLKPEQKVNDDDNSNNNKYVSYFQDAEQFNYGKALTFNEAKFFKRTDNPAVVVFAGFFKSGKTTLISSIYEMFQNFSFAEYMFAGSKTLAGFESRCFWSRKKSNLKEPDTARTLLIDTDRYLHLRLFNSQTYKIQNILFSDLSGEMFEDAMDMAGYFYNEEQHKLLLPYYFILLIDCKEMISQSPENIIQDNLFLLDRCFDEGIVNNKTAIDILFSS